MRKLPKTVAILVALCALAACTQREDGTIQDRKRRPDAATHTDAPAADAATTTSAGIVSCYTEGDPAQSCTLPVHCCFSNYSSEHDGYCTTATCAYGTIDCDGPEDCAAGEHCCSHALYASDGSLSGYAIGCQAAGCGAAPSNHELCHTDGPACSNGGTCVTAYLDDNDLPRTLDICQP